MKQSGKELVNLWNVQLINTHSTCLHHSVARYTIMTRKSIKLTYLLTCSHTVTNRYNCCCCCCDDERCEHNNNLFNTVYSE